MTTNNITINEVSLAPNLRLRPTRWDDLEAVAKLIYDVCAADGDTSVAVTPQELKHEWHNTDFVLERDAITIETVEGRVVGYAEFGGGYKHARLHIDGYVHPDFKGLGIGTTLLRTIEKRALEDIALAEPGLRVTLRNGIDNHDQAAHELHQQEGYKPLRYHWRMEVVLDGAPPEPKLPEGIELRPFTAGEQDVAIWNAQNEAFRDHWGSHDVSLEDWRHSRIEDPEFDPTLWKIAWDGNEVAGFSINRYRMGIGWIRSLGVRRPWRKRGLGEALLHASFGEFYGRGMKTIGLGVDAENPTGATRLYQKVGMHAASEFVTYEKELRPGRDVDEE